MTRVVYRYPVQLTERQTITMPTGAQILHLARRESQQIDMWALVDPDAPPQDRHFHCVGTGHQPTTTDTLTYVGTVLLRSGAFVFHFFEGAEGEPPA